MSRIFLSHFSIDKFEAVALKEWLAQNGWDDVFFDTWPQHSVGAARRAGAALLAEATALPQLSASQTNSTTST